MKVSTSGSGVGPARLIRFLVTRWKPITSQPQAPVSPPKEALRLVAVSGFRLGLPISLLKTGSLANSDSASGRRNEVPVEPRTKNSGVTSYCPDRFQTVAEE